MNNSTPDIPPLCLETRLIFYLKKGGFVLLFTLLTLDFLFMGLHTLKSLGYLHNPELSVTKNFGYAETFQYLKAAFIAGCFLFLGRLHRRSLFYCWSAVFVYVILDDSLEVHEYLGLLLSDFVTNNFHIGLGGTIGELLVFGSFGLLLFIPLGWYFYKSTNRDLKVVSQDLLILFTGMLFFGVGIDVVHDFAATGSIINGLLGLLEDGGEMIFLSLMGWYTWSFMKLDPYFEQKPTDNKKKKAKTIATKDRLPIASKKLQQKVSHKKRSA